MNEEEYLVLYENSQDFRDYVAKYATTKGIHWTEAIKHRLIQLYGDYIIELEKEKEGNA